MIQLRPNMYFLISQVVVSLKINSMSLSDTIARVWHLFRHNAIVCWLSRSNYYLKRYWLIINKRVTSQFISHRNRLDINHEIYFKSNKIFQWVIYIHICMYNSTFKTQSPHTRNLIITRFEQCFNNVLLLASNFSSIVIASTSWALQISLIFPY